MNSEVNNPMYAPNKALHTATIQDLGAALLLKRQFKDFESEPIVQELYRRSREG
ncbi:MAG: hypothetical protein AAFN08_08350 [Cyanobacteria bacterium J06559_3]